MGIWIELGIFLLVIVFGLWQIYDVRKEIRKREAQKAQQGQKPDSDAPK